MRYLILLNPSANRVYGGQVATLAEAELRAEAARVLGIAPPLGE